MKSEVRKQVHLIELSEMMVLPKHFLMRTSKAKFEFRKIAHLIERSLNLSEIEITSVFLWKG